MELQYNTCVNSWAGRGQENIALNNWQFLTEIKIERIKGLSNKFFAIFLVLNKKISIT